MEKIIHELLYANDGVHQCWSCKNRVGIKKVKITVPGSITLTTDIEVVLPECRVADLYMTEVYETPCSKWVQK